MNLEVTSIKFVLQEQKQALEGHLKERTEFLEEAAKEKYVIVSFLHFYEWNQFVECKLRNPNCLQT